MDERLAAVAFGRGGVFTSADATAVDLDDTVLTRLRRSGEVVRVRRDAYVLASSWSAARPEERLALRARAILAARPRDIASHQSALALRGLPLHGVPLDTVDLIADVSRVRLQAGLRTHVCPAGISVDLVEQYLCVRVPDAVAQVLVRSGLLPALVPLDAALHCGLLSLADLCAALDRFCSTPRLRRQGDRLLACADPLCESVGETRTRLQLLDAGLPVRSQVEIRTARGVLVGRVDLLVGDRVVVEFDGAVKYEGAAGRPALVAEKRREDDLRGLGYGVVRVTWSDLDRPGGVVPMVRRAMTVLSASDGRLPAS